MAIVIILLLVCIIPIAVIVLIVQAIVKRNNKEEKKDFEEIVRGIYIYLILIITLVAIITGVITAFRVGLDVALPEQYITTTSYNSQEREHNENMIDLLTTISIVITSLPIFIYHNKLAKKDKEMKKVEIAK